MAGTGTVSSVPNFKEGVSGPKLTGPPAVATKKLTLAPALKWLPAILKEAPTRIVAVTELMTGGGPGVGIGDGVRVGVRVGARVGVAVAPPTNRVAKVEIS